LRLNKSIILFLIILVLLRCTTQQPIEQEKKILLEGEWEFVELLTFDSTIKPDPEMKVWKIIFEDNWAVTGHNYSVDRTWVFAGSYRVTEETYVEYIEVAVDPEYFGDSIVYKYSFIGDTLLLMRRGSFQKWKKIE